jgi:ATP synthase subunit 6
MQIFCVLIVATLTAWGYAAIKHSAFLSTNAWTSTGVVVQERLMGLVAQNLGLAGQVYYPFIVVLFLFLLTANVLGLIPYTFTVTSHIVVTLALSFTFFIGSNLRLILDQKLGFFALFLPSGAPLAIAPFLIVVEIISYTARVASLAIRLFANMMAGHSLLKILIGFVYALAVSSSKLGIFVVPVLPFLVVVAVTFLEAGVAVVQAYVFTVLICIYLKDLYVAH